MRYRTIIAVLMLVSMMSGCNSCSNSGSSAFEESPATNLDKLIVTSRLSSSDIGSSISAPPKGADDVNYIPAVSYVYYGLSLTDPSAKKLTPDMSDIRDLGIAPNGDFWFRNKYGIFSSNLNSSDVKPQIMIADQKMATGFIDTSKAGVYRTNPVNAVTFFPIPDDKDGAYLAFFDVSIGIDTAAEGEEGASQITLKYDSRDGSITRLLFPGSAIRNEGDIVISTYNISKFSKKDGIFVGLMMMSGGKIYYMVLRYDPMADKYYLIDRTVEGVSSSMNCINTDPFHDGCYTIDHGIGDLAALQCKVEIKDDPSTQKTRNLVLDCVNAKLQAAQMKLLREEVKEEDVTSYFKSKEEMLKLKDKELSHSKTEKASIPFKNLSPSDLGYINCYGSYCSFVELIRGFDPLMSRNFLYYVGTSTDEAGAVWNVIYRQGIDGGEPKIIDKSQTASISLMRSHIGNYNGLSFASNNDELGDVILYGKYSDAEYAYYVYSSSKDKSVMAFDSSYSPVSFRERKGSVDISERALTSDGRYLFVTKRYIEGSEASFYRTFYLDVLGLFNQGNNTMVEAIAMNDAQLSLLWKGRALWLTDDAVYINEPFAADKTAKQISAGTDFSKRLATVKAFVPPAGSGFSISSDFGKSFECGAGGEYALYCANATDMCENGKCVSKFVKECDNHADCKVTGLCVNDKCRAFYCYSNSDCSLGQECKDGSCKGLDHADQCVEDGQCYVPDVVYNSAVTAKSIPTFLSKDVTSGSSYGTKKCQLDAAVGYNRCVEVQVDVCSIDSECDNGFKCLDTNRCAASCKTDAECQGGWSCIGSGVCGWVDIAPECTQNSDCGGNTMACLTYNGNNYCVDKAVSIKSNHRTTTVTDKGIEFLYDFVLTFPPHSEYAFYGDPTPYGRYRMQVIAKDGDGNNVSEEWHDLVPDRDYFPQQLSFFVPGNVSSRTFQLNLYAFDSKELLITELTSVKLNNSDHCMLTGGDKCETGHICSNNICVTPEELAECDYQGKTCTTDFNCIEFDCIPKYIISPDFDPGKCTMKIAPSSVDYTCKISWKRVSGECNNYRSCSEKDFIVHQEDGSVSKDTEFNYDAVSPDGSYEANVVLSVPGDKFSSQFRIEISQKKGDVLLAATNRFLLTNNIHCMLGYNTSTKCPKNYICDTAKHQCNFLFNRLPREQFDMRGIRDYQLKLPEGVTK